MTVGEEKPCTSAGPQQLQFTGCSQGLQGYVYISKLNSARPGSVSPQTTGADRTCPCAVLTPKRSPDVVWESSGCAGLHT